MKNNLFLFICFFSLTMAGSNATAQIKIYDDNSVSLGCLNKNYGLQVTQTGYTYLRTQSSLPYVWANLSMANLGTQKHWIVEKQYGTTDLGEHLFYVQGDGTVYYSDNYQIQSNPNDKSRELVDGDLALSTILGLNACYFEEDPSTTPEEIENSEFVEKDAVEGMIAELGKKSVSLFAENVAEVFPDAVRTDPQARLCIDYNAIVTMLTRAMRQQQEEIEQLREVLRENGLMNP